MHNGKNTGPGTLPPRLTLPEALQGDAPLPSPPIRSSSLPPPLSIPPAIGGAAAPPLPTNSPPPPQPLLHTQFGRPTMPPPPRPQEPPPPLMDEPSSAERPLPELPERPPAPIPAQEKEEDTDNTAADGENAEHASDGGDVAEAEDEKQESNDSGVITKPLLHPTPNVRTTRVVKRKGPAGQRRRSGPLSGSAVDTNNNRINGGRITLARNRAQTSTTMAMDLSGYSGNSPPSWRTRANTAGQDSPTRASVFYPRTGGVRDRIESLQRLGGDNAAGSAAGKSATEGIGAGQIQDRIKNLSSSLHFGPLAAALGTLSTFLLFTRSI